MIGIDSLSLSLRYSSDEDLPFEEETFCQFEDVVSLTDCCRFFLGFNQYYALYDNDLVMIIDIDNDLYASIDLKNDLTENTEDISDMLEIEEGKAAGMILFLHHFFLSGMRKLYG